MDRDIFDAVIAFGKEKIEGILGAGRWQSMQSTTTPAALLVWVEERQATTAGLISWQEAQNSGVEVRTMV
jgi:hypothetical protein